MNGDNGIYQPETLEEARAILEADPRTELTSLGDCYAVCSSAGSCLVVRILEAIRENEPIENIRVTPRYWVPGFVTYYGPDGSEYEVYLEPALNKLALAFDEDGVACSASRSARRTKAECLEILKRLIEEGKHVAERA